MEHYNIDALVETHGNEDLIKALVAPLNGMIDNLNAATERLAGSEEFVKATEQNIVAEATQEFLMSKGMETYRDTYGGEEKDLTDEQIKNRMELFEQADILAAGARDHNVDMTIRDALERAHILKSQGTRDETIRQSLRESMKKRTKTTKSSHKKTVSPDSNEPVSEDELERRTAVRLQEFKGKIN